MLKGPLFLGARRDLAELITPRRDRLRRMTLIPVPRWLAAGLSLLALAASASLGFASAALGWLP